MAMPTASDMSSSQLRNNFAIMCTAFAINISCVISCLTYASTLLGNLLGGIGNGVLFISYAFMSLLFAQPIVAMVGPKNGLFLGCCGYSLYVFGFLVSILLPQVSWVLFLLASLVGGVSGSLLWVAQGRYFARNAKLFADSCTTSLEEVNSTFAGMFAAIFLGLECTLRALASVVFVGHGETAQDVVFSLYSVLSLLSVVLLSGTSNLEENGTRSFDYEFVVMNAASTGKLIFSDCKLALLIPYQFAYGLASSFVPFYVFGTVIGDSDQLGKTYLGLLSAIIPFTGSSAAMPAAWVANKVGNLCNMTVGAIGLAGTGAVLFFTSNSHLGTWPAIVPYMLMYGVGRGFRFSQESTSKAVVADYCSLAPKNTTAAFAAVSFSSGVASALGYFIFSSLSRDAMCAVVTVSSVLGLVCYYISHWLYLKEHRSPLIDVLPLANGESMQ